jgi:hypothetical protein
MRIFLLAAAAPTAFLCSTSAQAWGSSGHRTVCEIAYLNLTPTARAEVDRLLQGRPAALMPDMRNAEFGWACTYPDRPVAGGPPRRDAEHFINYARDTAEVTLDSGCGVTIECVDTAIISDLARLKSPDLPVRLRAVALIYLGHWVGDIHQPLHNSFADDRGGNEIKVSGQCSSSLHSAWDTCILQRGFYANSNEPSVEAVKALATTWSAQVSDAQRASWLSAAPWQWSKESYAVTISPATQYCVMVQTSCQYDQNRPSYNGSGPRTVTVDAQYSAMAMPIVQARITQGGVRLAHLINLALDPAYHPLQ